MDGRLDPDCFAPAQQFVLNILEKRFFNDYLNSVAHCKYVLELLNYGPIFITDILYNEAAVIHFTEVSELVFYFAWWGAELGSYFAINQIRNPVR